MPKYRLSLIHIFPYMERITSVFFRIWTESENLPKYWKIRIRFCPYMGNYRSEKARFLAFFTQWSPHERVLIFSEVVDCRHVTLLQIYIFLMISTTGAQQPYFIAPMTTKYILKITSRHLLTMQSNHPMSIVFLQERHCFSRKHTGISGAQISEASTANMTTLSHYF